ncbi:hypothetical protein ACSP97_30930 [Streptomyces sp. SCPE 10]|uniref:hypothetical protein n=1 Tax=unclassified Streptomyces TaxID=2593676 RepID=UPI003F4AD472
MNHRHVSAVVVLASAAALLATTCGSAGASPNAPVRTAKATAWKPCHLPSGYQRFVELDSAGTVKGRTVVRVTPQTCKVNKENDEDVVYTPSGAARSVGFASGASVEVLRDTTTVKVAPQWLVKHKLANSPYFAFRVNGKGRITAMREIYHP